MEETVGKFREQFDEVSSVRYEEDPKLIDESARRTVQLRDDEHAIEAIEISNETPDVKEIMNIVTEIEMQHLKKME